MNLSSESEDRKVSWKPVCPDIGGRVEGKNPLQAPEQKWLEVAGGGTEEHGTQDAKTGQFSEGVASWPNSTDGHVDLVTWRSLMRPDPWHPF